LPLEDGSFDTAINIQNIRHTWAAHCRGEASGSAVLDALQLISRLARVVMEDLYGFEGVVVQVLSNYLEVRRNALRDGDDVADRIIGLKDVQQFSRTGPEEFDVGIFRNDLRGG